MVKRAESGRVLGQENAIFNKEISVGLPAERAAKQMPSGNVLEGTSTCCAQQLLRRARQLDFKDGWRVLEEEFCRERHQSQVHQEGG